MRRLPTVWSIFWTDTASYPMTCFGVMCFGMALAVKLTGTVPGSRGKPDRPVDPELASMILAGGVLLCLFVGAIVAWRVARVRELFERGEEVEATVLKVSRLRGGGRLKLEFERAGTTYRVRSSFQTWWTPPTFEEGTRIVLLIDPLNPKRCVPVALYATPPTPPGRRELDVRRF